MSGWLMGGSLGFVLIAIGEGRIFFPAAFLAFLCVLELEIAWLFHRTGNLEAYLEKYERGVYRSP